MTHRAGIVALLCCLGAGAASAADARADPRRSGFDDMSPATQAMQRDDTLNPAMLWVQEGEALWNAKAGSSQQSCAGCHGAAASSMRGVAARYPAWDRHDRRPIDLAQRIAQCRVQRQQASPLALDSEPMLSLESYVALQSRGLPIAPPDEPALAPFIERGRQRFTQRIGQLDLSCAQCHDERAGQRLGGSLIPQAHPTGYPIYRLEWQRMGSLQRRLRNCIAGIRAEPFPYGAPELVELELYLATRAAGMRLESPGVRP